MKKTALIVFVLLFQYSFSKPITETQKLVVTCKFGDFLKYYHTNVANGNFDWDEQLFRILPKVEEAKTDIEFSNIIEKSMGFAGKSILIIIKGMYLVFV